MDVLVLNKNGEPLSMMPLSMISWQVAIRLMALDKVTVLKDHDNWVVRSPSITMKVPSVVICSDYIKWNRQVNYNRTNVLLRDNFACQYCGAMPPANQLTLDHVVPKSHGGKTNWKNVVACCKNCNSKKGNNANIVPKKMPVRPSYYELAAKRKKYPVRIRDEFWKSFIDWPEELIQVTPYTNTTRSNTNG
jgi:5-methylcytosine-specific restriction endonuclease McrA